MNKTALEIDPTLLRLSAGIPAAGVGGLIGYLAAPKGHKLDGAGRGAGAGYIAGTGIGAGAELGARATTDGENRTANMLAGGLLGGGLGAGIGQLMQGKPEWQRRQEVRAELMAMLKDHSHQKHAEEHPTDEHEELALIPAAGAAGGAFVANGNKPTLPAVLRGILQGMGAGAGALGGAAIGGGMTEDPMSGKIVGGGIGGLLGLLAVRKLTAREKSAEPGPVLQQLLAAKQLSDQRKYKGKHAKLRQLLEQYPQDFIIDSSNDGIVGLTHKRLGFKIHAPAHVLPQSFMQEQANAAN